MRWRSRPGEVVACLERAFAREVELTTKADKGFVRHDLGVDPERPAEVEERSHERAPAILPEISFETAPRAALKEPPAE